MNEPGLDKIRKFYHKNAGAILAGKITEIVLSDGDWDQAEKEMLVRCGILTAKEELFDIDHFLYGGIPVIRENPIE